MPRKPVVITKQEDSQSNENKEQEQEQEQVQEQNNEENSTYEKRVGTKDEVYAGIAYRTSGGLLKKDLKINKTGKVVSAKKSEQGERLYSNFIKRSLKTEDEIKNDETPQ